MSATILTMTKPWHTLTQLTGGSALEIERVRLTETGIALEGPFELPPLARLTADDQVFVAAFVRCHGSIKQMEKYFGVSYPTIKNRLNKIGQQLPFVEIANEPSPAPSPAAALLDQLERGEMTATEVLARLTQKGEHHG